MAGKFAVNLVSGRFVSWGLSQRAMSTPRIFSLTVLYLLATIFAPMPCCCCGALGDPYPGTLWEDITEEQRAIVAVQDVYSFYFGMLGIAGVTLFLPATILLNLGQKRNSNGSDVCRWFGFGLMFFWMFVVLLVSAFADISSADISPVQSDMSHWEDWIWDTAEVLNSAFKVLAINAALALFCTFILVRKPKCLSEQSH